MLPGSGALPHAWYDSPNIHLCTVADFDAFLDKYRLTDPALQVLARIVRGADTDARELAPEAWGLYAVASGFREITRRSAERIPTVCLSAQIQRRP